MTEKESRLASFCRERGVDGVFLRRRSNIAWITDGADVHIDSGSPLGIAAILWTPSRKIVLTDTIEAPRLRSEEFDSEWEIRTHNWWESPSVPSPQTCATDWPDDQIAHLRFSLTDFEVIHARDLGHEAAAALCDALRAVSRGDSEHELAALISARLRRRAIFAPVLLVEADARLARFRHPIPTGAGIDRVVMAAICAQRRGLIVSATRLVHFGRVPEDLRLRHEAVCRVDAALHQATRPGARWCDLFALAQKLRRPRLPRRVAASPPGRSNGLRAPRFQGHAH
jgi:antitoxin VapB